LILEANEKDERDEKKEHNSNTHLPPINISPIKGTPDKVKVVEAIKKE
jgi:hypothetical protein